MSGCFAINDLSSGDEKDEKSITTSAAEIVNDAAVVLCDDYFRGYFAFALWGYIPPEGGEQYKSSLMGTVVDTGGSVKEENSRKGARDMKVEEKSYQKALDERGVNNSVIDRNDKLDALSDIMIKGRK